MEQEILTAWSSTQVIEETYDVDIIALIEIERNIDG